MSYYKDCTITIAMPTDYKYIKKIETGMSAKFTGATIELVAKASEEEPYVDAASVPCNHPLASAAAQVAPGAAMKGIGEELLLDAANDALSEILKEA